MNRVKDSTSEQHAYDYHGQTCKKCSEAENPIELCNEGEELWVKLSEKQGE